MSEEDRRALYRLEAELRAIRKKMGSVGDTSRWSIVATHAVWFLLPFLCLWSLGVEPTTAARVSVAPCCIMMVVGLGAWTWMTSSAEGVIVKATTALEAVERVGEEG